MSDTAEYNLTSWGVTPLVQAATGAIDLNELAHQELARRGLNAKGEAVGTVNAYNDWFDAHGGEPKGEGKAKASWCEACNDVLVPIGKMCDCGVINNG